MTGVVSVIIRLVRTRVSVISHDGFLPRLTVVRILMVVPHIRASSFIDYGYLAGVRVVLLLLLLVMLLLWLLVMMLLSMMTPNLMRAALLFLNFHKPPFFLLLGLHLLMEGFKNPFISLFRCILSLFIQPVLCLIKILFDLLECFLLFNLASILNNLGPILIQLFLQHVLSLLPGHFSDILLHHCPFRSHQVCVHITWQPSKSGFSKFEINHRCLHSVTFRGPSSFVFFFGQQVDFVQFYHPILVENKHKFKVGILGLFTLDLVKRDELVLHSDRL